MGCPGEKLKGRVIGVSAQRLTLSDLKCIGLQTVPATSCTAGGGGDRSLATGVRENAATRFAFRVLDLGVEITPTLERTLISPDPFLAITRHLSNEDR